MARAGPSFVGWAKALFTPCPPPITKSSEWWARCALPTLHRSSQASVLGLVDQRALLDPRHHVAEFCADFLDRVLGELGAGGLERSLVDLVLQHPVAGELAALDVGEDALHLGLGLG